MTAVSSIDSDKSVQPRTVRLEKPPAPTFGTALAFPVRTTLEYEPPDENLPGIVASELESLRADLIAGQPGVSNAELYDILHDRLCGPDPMERPPLLRFAQLVAAAIRSAVEQVALARVAGSQSAKSTKCQAAADVKSESTETEDRKRQELEKLDALRKQGRAPTGFLFAEGWPEDVIRRCEVLRDLATSDAAAFQCFELAEFAGCNDAEIALLLDQPVDAVTRRRRRVIAAI